MHRTRALAVTSAAADIKLLSPQELRQAVGLLDDSADTDLAILGLRVAAAIAAECGIEIGSGASPTLKQETLQDTFRGVWGENLVLSRRHEVTITSVVEDSVTLTASDYEVEPEPGFLRRLSNDEPIDWCASKVVVTYRAGFATIPDDLKMAASDFVRLLYNERTRDPAVKARETDVPGVLRERVDYWVGSLPGQVGEGAVPDVVAGQLARFRNRSF